MSIQQARLMAQTQFLTDREIYERVILEAIPGARRYLWMATSDLKDLYVARRTRTAPFLEVLSELAGHGVSIRLIHAKEPGPAFQRDFDRYPNLIEGMERLLCPRVHLKCVVVDGALAYSGSANLTGAGMGAKSDHRRNFESGILTSEGDLVGRIAAQFDAIWMGKHCGACGRKAYCAEHRGLAES